MLNAYTKFNRRTHDVISHSTAWDWMTVLCASTIVAVLVVLPLTQLRQEGVTPHEATLWQTTLSTRGGR
ncbi:hypothetical protein PN441_09180 [Spirulina major CS-329]|uniref:hypothetical protein n=1 Tax=Spirulina TaxID=1154 RepID=UPI00232CA71B|nr:MULTISPECIES: hypothetical protein [Spirulina]MDB9496543.1 hypothetical protein [Spirulina subsalsa CS-330]MDB9503244.1 hypothetical protein [Spirulina major CS-329]